MPEVLMGQRVKELVRRYFMEGAKSTNKLYTSKLEGDDDPITRKSAIRMRDQYLGSDYLDDIKQRYKGGTQSDYAVHLLHPHWLASSKLTGNCGEMTALAAYLVERHELIPSSQIYTCSIAEPGDHAFCVVSDSAVPEKLRSASTLVDFLATDPNYLIIDPWLNTACLSRDYIRQSGARLAKWQQSGKRVYWKGMGKETEGWHPPAEQYKGALYHESPITLTPHS